ncbi:hypothetical protein [Shimia sp.]|uniref:hypothetical protein n=1 Tax=Shimia sp. TaxID=1954381 RepID=UPI003298264B
MTQFKSTLMAGTALVCQFGIVNAEQSDVPLHNTPTRLYSFETANVNPGGTLQLSVGTSQANTSSTTGTGNQTYFGGGSYSVNDQLSFGLDLQNYVDPVASPINGLLPEVKMTTLAFSGKYQFFSNDKMSFAVQGSVESFVTLESPLFGGKNSNVIIGSLKAPATFNAAPGLQFHLTPSVSFLPDTLNGTQFYGTIASLGGGVSYKPSDRLSFYGSVDMPFSGSNTISSTGTYEKKPVWVVGGRYNVTPKVALDAYVTNGIGITPATSVLTMWPEGDSVLAGVQLVYTPGAKRPESYRGVPMPVTSYQASLQQDGFTMGSADVVEPGRLRVGGWYGSDSSGGVLFGLSPDRDVEVQFIVEDYSNNPTVPAALIPRNDARYMIGGKLRFMDQNNGNPFSMAARALYGRSTSSNNQIGVFFLEGMASYKTQNQLTLTANPKIAAFGSTELAGLGLGLNYEVTDGLELIAEATPVWVDGTDATWAAGLRYNVGQSGFSVDAMATNAIGRYGLGTMVAQDDVRVSVMLSKTFDLRGIAGR